MIFSYSYCFKILELDSSKHLSRCLDKHLFTLSRSGDSMVLALDNSSGFDHG